MPPCLKEGKGSRGSHYSELIFKSSRTIFILQGTGWDTGMTADPERQQEDIKVQLLVCFIFPGIKCERMQTMTALFRPVNLEKQVYFFRDCCRIYNGMRRWWGECMDSMSRNKTLSYRSCARRSLIGRLCIKRREQSSAAETLFRNACP